VPIDKPDREQLKVLAEADASVEIPASVLLHLLTSIEELESENGRLKTKLAGYQTNSVQLQGEWGKREQIVSGRSGRNS
jgi:hypothetical protein